ncbi:serine/threonine-protein kinase [Bradymonas sediminis]|uniref:Protein kinase domain-containing protein n=1 Tax=Bradymonas sediminis TaxID=1548548 RepID=A0A2Z4FJV4_9DELT|nr:serine/threonine-protein kinase [Bradymonas sediminis]AWV89115.1 hypothetical protein DN745_07110 [Bradymonas sediminis]TDP64419.1 serine/threonine protein kinase [Bradymonas sediminis]
MKITLRIGDVSLSEIIAHGSIGEVWRGTHSVYHYPIALKKLSNATKDVAWRRREFEYELALLKTLSHPGIVTVYDTETLDGTPVLAMEMAENSCADTPRLASWGAVRALLLQVLGALDYLHAKQIIHCDIKPANILRFSSPASAPAYKLIDFGIAQLTAATPRTAGACPREYRGSPEYSAPEQIRGETENIGPWTDLYALGCTIYAVATGRPPFGSDGFIPLTQAHLNTPAGPFCPDFEVPATLQSWLHQLMRKDPADRFASAQAATEALLNLPAPPPRSRSLSPEIGPRLK